MPLYTTLLYRYGDTNYSEVLLICAFSVSLCRPPDLGKDPLVTGKQAVEIKHTLKEPRSLSDPVQTTGHTRELRQRDACWRQANGKLRRPQTPSCLQAPHPLLPFMLCIRK